MCDPELQNTPEVEETHASASEEPEQAPLAVADTAAATTTATFAPVVTSKFTGEATSETVLIKKEEPVAKTCVTRRKKKRRKSKKKKRVEKVLPVANNKGLQAGKSSFNFSSSPRFAAGVVSAVSLSVFLSFRVWSRFW